ncbi:MAG: preprotein translocase subunit SecG [Alphaproteobacteria bacterium]|nr:preprotein translocase subunit SecG [Alphaproteobacteria bacterium]
MFTVVVVIHLLLAVSLVAVILLQKSEGGALGIGGGGMSGFMTGRSTANLLTRTTAILTACFFGTSIALAMIASRSRAPTSVIDRPVTTQSAPATPGKPPVPAAPAAPLTK